jgi:GDPmannose 4,6-dehydratase
MKKALITGITGQDGSYLAELLLGKGYQVHGLVRRSSSPNLQRIEQLLIPNREIVLHEGDLSDSSSLERVVDQIEPDEIYNLAAMSHVRVSFDVPEYTADISGLGVVRLLEAVRKNSPHTRFYQASTSELFGKVQQVPQSETTPFYPRSPYGVAKLYAYWTVVNYREAYQLYACNGILFNHESPRRGETFVSKKITLAVAKIAAGLQDKLILGNLDAKRDWGYAKDYVEGMWLMLQQAKPEDFILATGETTTVRDFVKLAFEEVGVDIEWSGRGVDEKGHDKITGRVVVEISPEFFRPSEVDLLIGDPGKAKAKLGWSSKTSLKELVQVMMKHDIELVRGSSRDLFYARS